MLMRTLTCIICKWTGSWRALAGGKSFSLLMSFWSGIRETGTLRRALGRGVGIIGGIGSLGMLCEDVVLSIQRDAFRSNRNAEGKVK